MFGCSKKQGTAGIWREQQAPTGKVQNTEGPSGKCPKPKDKTTGSTEKFPKHRQKHNNDPNGKGPEHTNTAGPYGKCSKHTEKQNRPQCGKCSKTQREAEQAPTGNVLRTERCRTAPNRKCPKHSEEHNRSNGKCPRTQRGTQQI